jgi:hypothetical protein
VHVDNLDRISQWQHGTCTVDRHSVRVLMVQKLQRMMEPNGSRYSESQEGLLKVVASLGAALTTPSAQMLLLGMLIARLGNGCARMQATVASLLEGAIAVQFLECDVMLQYYIII